MQTLQRKSGSGVVTIRKEWLELDGLLEDDGGIPEQQCVDVERLGRRTYVVRFPEGGELPELAEAPLMQRIAAQVQFVPRAEVERTERAD